MTDDEDKPERGKSKFWLELISDGEQALHAWQDTADNIDKIYASLSRMGGIGRDREFQLFWSNIQVMGPSIYARPPVPVVTPKFKDRRPLHRTASELLERCCLISFDIADIDQTMIALRDDLAILGRGASWVRYDSDDGDKVCYEHVDRKDFLHQPARKWSEVEWVARRGWLTREEMRKRFGDDAEMVSYSVTRDDKGNASTEKCGVWEIWHKTEKKVAWATEGFEETLEESAPHLKLEGFFPCPKPAYGTVERRSLVPVPDLIFYKDQLEEVHALTRRIHALSDAVKVRGFYAGGGDLGDAIETAIRMADDTQILVPVPAMASLMQGGGDPIIWLPLEMVASTITGLIELRRQVIDDVYQIIGLSDIMRGSTVASETLGAQQLKQQNGSYRVRDKQNELVRVARDLVRIGAEIMANEFSRKTLETMAQMDLPTAADQKKKLKDYEGQAKAELEGLMEQAQGMAEQAMQQAQQSGQPIDPAQMQEMQQQAEQQFNEQQQAIIAKWSKKLQECQDEITIDAVMDFLSDEKLRPFALDIETDSTIYPDEMAEKQSRQEFMTAFAGTMAALQPMFMMGPEAISVAGGVFKFALSPYRVGRELEGLIDDFVDQGPAMAERLQGAAGDNGAEEMAKATAMMAEAEMMKAQADVAKVQTDMQIKGQQMEQDAQSKVQDMQVKVEKERADLQLSAAELQLKSRETAVSEREVAVKEALAGVTVQTAQVDNGIKRGEVVMQSGEQLPMAVALSIAPMLEQMQATAAQQTAMIAAMMSAPKEIVRGPDGRAVGVRTMVQ